MKLLTVKEIATMLGVTTSSVYNLIQSKEVNFYKIGDSIRIREDDFYKYLEKQKIDAVD